eukprot:SAG11_NODE_682_length_7769_cov_45.167275_1_plen_44_part_00
MNNKWVCLYAQKQVWRIEERSDGGESDGRMDAAGDSEGGCGDG